MKTPYDNYKHRSICSALDEFQAYWITSERFYHLPAIRQYGHNRLPEFNSEIRNIHTLFRKSFRIERSVREAVAYITADDLYKLYINGEFVGEGPAQSYPFAYNYNAFDITDLIAKGENAIAVQVYYQGLFNIYLVSADNLSGMIAELHITYDDGSREIIKSDRTWKYRESDAYTAKYEYGYQTQFSEDIDLKKLRSDWREVGFDDSGWSSPEVAARPYPTEYNLIPQITPTVKHEKVYPKRIVTIDGGYLLDYGWEVVGSPIIEIRGREGDKLELRFAEELDEGGRARYEIRANCTYRDEHTLSGKDDLVEYFDYKAYRYMEILGAPKDFDPKTVYTIERCYPFPEKTASFNSSDEKMNGIWNICERGVRIGTQDTYYDCPTREKGGFVGDALISGLSHLILTADLRIYEKFIRDAANASRYCPAVMAHLPTYDINICADYSALIPLFIEKYYDYTGNAEFVKKMLPVAEGIWEYYSQFLNSEGLLEKIGHMKKVPSDMKAILVDWPQNLRDGYDMDAAENGISTNSNLFFYGFLKTTTKLYDAVGDKKRSDELTEIYKRMERGIIAKLYDEESGLFRDAYGSEHFSIHANALQLFFGLKPPRGYAPIRDLIMKRRLNCGVYFAYFVIEGLFRTGYADEAIDLLRGEDEHSWVNMLKSGATTCMEAWGPDQKWNTSWCHPWSSSPIYFYVERLMGIRSKEPGMKKFVIAPRVSEDIDFIELSFPTPSGFIELRYERREAEKYIEFKAPEAVTVESEHGSNITLVRL